MVSICPVCRKEFEILHPPLWRYKINNEYVCSWSCLRKGENKGVETTKREVPQTAKDEAVRIAIEGGDPIEYLGKYSINPRGMWTYIRSVLKDKDPETFAKIPNLRKQPPKKALRKEEAPKRPRKKKVTVTRVNSQPAVDYKKEMNRALPVEMVQDMNGIRVGPEKPDQGIQILRVRSVKTGIDYYLSDDQERMVMESGGDLFNVQIGDLPDFLNELPPICRHLGVKV